MTDPAALEDGYKIREFIKSPAQLVLQKHMKYAMDDALSRVMGSDPEDDPFHLMHWRGVYEGLKRALVMPEHILRQAGLGGP